MGKVLFVTGPSAPRDARLLRAQSLALSNGMALTISRELIEAKFQGQENLVRHKLNDVVAADAMAGFRASLADADSLDRVRILEGHAAVVYWNVLSGIAVMWPKADSRKIPS